MAYSSIVPESRIEVESTTNGGIQIVKAVGLNGRTRLCTLSFEEGVELQRELRVKFTKMQDERVKGIQSGILEVERQIATKQADLTKLQDRLNELTNERSNVLRIEP